MAPLVARGSRSVGIVRLASRQTVVGDKFINISAGSIAAIVLGVVVFILLIVLWVMNRRSGTGGIRRR